MRLSTRLVAFGTCLLALIISTNGEIRAGQITVIETVAGTQGPWSYVAGGLNTDYQYGINNQGGPTVTSAASGIDFSAGGVLTVTYISGTVFSPDRSGAPRVDANGDHNYLFNNMPGSTGEVAPSFYMNPASYPIYLVELVGTFADSSGAIVGSPFVLGNGPAMLTIPIDATQLQLGANDDQFADNGGAWTISVAGPAVSSVPEPSSLLLLLIPILGFLGGALLRK